ncbi:MAG: hypothetical protein JWO57_4372 [Pseudonocardiales bacterium]|nr:hypothetical protein [Pseudonocardiales bacterium]
MLGALARRTLTGISAHQSLHLRECARPGSGDLDQHSDS